MGHGEKWERLGDGSLLTQDADEGLGHIVPKSTYRNVFIALLIGTLLTVWVAFYDFGPLNIFLKLGIASVKAILVCAYFMHLRWDKPLVVFVAVYPLVIVALLFLGTLGDFSIKEYPEPTVLKNVLESS